MKLSLKTAPNNLLSGHELEDYVIVLGVLILNI